MPKKGMYKCKKCKGTGKTHKKFYFMFEGKHLEGQRNIQCPICKGDKWVDWVEQVVGKKMSNADKETHKR